MTRQDLLNFTKEITKIYNTGIIKAPIHLSKGNENQLIRIFNKYNITQKDWILSTWRNHFHWLLSGRDAEELKKQILEGRSMQVCGEKFLTSAIVGGIAPIALGVAMALKLKGITDRKVYCFLGDMAYSGGLAKECIQYASGHNLPIKYIVENNFMSVNAITQDTWGKNKTKVVEKYKYTREVPHAGTGVYLMW